MGSPSRPESALLFVGALYRDEAFLAKATEKLGECFGELLLESPSFPWDSSDYYREELGRPLRRRFLFFGNPFTPERLAEIKLQTNGVEQELSEEGKRTINLDPGYLTLAKVVLASTKNYAHRIAIGKGIYAEVMLIYRDGKYRSQ